MRDYHLAAWKSPRVRTNASARAAYYGPPKDIGTTTDVAQVAAAVRDLVGESARVEPELGALTINVPASQIRRVADPLRGLFATLGYVLFDPQSERLVVPARPSATPWPPDWVGSIAAVEDAVGEVSPDSDREAYREALLSDVLRRTGGKVIEPPDTVQLPFPTQPGFVLPFLVPNRLRTSKRLASLSAQLDGRRRVTTRRGAASLLGGWQGHMAAMDLLRLQLSVDSDILTRGMCALGLALSDAADPDELVVLASVMTQQSHTDVDLEGVSYALFAVVVAARYRHRFEVEAKVARLLSRIPDPEAKSQRLRSLDSLVGS